MNRGQSLCLAGGVALVFGAFLPWATVQSLVLGVSRSMAGYQGDSIIAGGAGLILLLVGVTAKPTAGKRHSAFAVVLALVAGLVVLLYLPAAADGTKPASGIIVTNGPGLYLSLVGCVLALVGGLQTTPGVPIVGQPPAPAMPIPDVQPTTLAPAASPKKPMSPIITIALVVWALLVLVVVGAVLFGGG